MEIKDKKNTKPGNFVLHQVYRHMLGDPLEKPTPKINEGIKLNYMLKVSWIGPETGSWLLDVVSERSD